MPYRGEMPLGACVAHPLMAATAHCDDCGAAICDECVSFARTAPRCLACAHSIEHRRSALRYLAAYSGALIALLLMFVVDFVAFDYALRRAEHSQQTFVLTVAVGAFFTLVPIALLVAAGAAIAAAKAVASRFRA
jgi:hypothetical protein